MIGKKCNIMFNKEVNKSQIAAIHALLNKHNLMDDKAKIVEQISGGRTTSTTGLTWNEAQAWINAMNKGLPRQETASEEKVKRQRMINSIIAMAREMGVIQRKAVLNAAGKIEEKSDYSTFNDWLLHKSCVKKENLNQCNNAELPLLVTQYKAIYMHFLKKHH